MNITRGVTCVVLIGSLCWASGAEAAAKAPVRKHTRTLEMSYQPGPTTHTLVGLGGAQLCVTAGTSANCLKFSVAKDEKYLSLTATDASGLAIGITMYPDTGSTGVATETFYCGTTKSTPIDPNTDWTISADTISADAGCPAVATTGTVKVTLSNLP